jgi:hypothetical protein
MHQPGPQFVVDGRVDQDALHADAALSGLVEGARHQARGDIVQVGARVDDAGGVAAEFEHDLFLAGPRFELPADRRRSGEAQHFQPRVGGEQVGAVAMAGQDRKGAPRQVGLRQDFTDQQRPHRGAAGGLEHEWTAGGDGRSDFMRRQIQREVERRDEGAGPDGHPLDHAAIPAGARRDFEVQDLAVDADGFLGRNPKGIDQTRDFPPAVLDRLAGFDAQGVASSSFRAWKRATQWLRTCCRAYGGRWRSGPLASTAASMAASIAAVSARATRVAASPLYLSVTTRSVFGSRASLARK